MSDLNDLAAHVSEDFKKVNPQVFGMPAVQRVVLKEGTKAQRASIGTPHESESDFQAYVLELARLTGWHTAHFRAGMTRDGKWVTAVSGDGKGFPDLLLVRDKVLFREVKTDEGKLTREQQAWGKWLRAGGADWDVWRPSMRAEIERELRG